MIHLLIGESARAVHRSSEVLGDVAILPRQTTSVTNDN